MSKIRSRAATLRQKTALADEADGLWGVALLRVALDLKRKKSVPLGQIIDQVAEQMRLPRARLATYVQSHFGPLEVLSALNRQP